MKATGIVRRIDDLGRVVIPKEIRRTMRIREGDPLEIYTNSGGEVVFKKYSPIGEMSDFAVQYAEALSHGTQLSVLICDRDRCVAAAGLSKKETLDKPVSQVLENVMQSRKSKVFSEDNKSEAVEGFPGILRVAVPILSAGDIGGVVALLANSQKSTADEGDIKLASVAADFIGRQME